jgi:hypothetical protein
MIAVSMALIGVLFPAACAGVLALCRRPGALPRFWARASRLFAELGWWRGAFWINLPVIVCFLIVCRRLPGKDGEARKASALPFLRLGVLGLAVTCVALTGLTRAFPMQAGLILAAGLLVFGTVKLDARAQGRIFPSRPFSPDNPIGAANWVLALSSMTHAVIGAFLPLAMQVLHGVSDKAAGYALTGLALSWTFASMATSHMHGRAAMACILVGQALCVVGLGAMAAASPPCRSCWSWPSIALSAWVSEARLHLVGSAMRLARPGEESVTASAIPMIRSLGVAFGSAGAGAVANLSGLTDDLAAPGVASAIHLVLLVGCLAPIGAFLSALRFVRMTGGDAHPDTFREPL